jgi:hypothetical protein
MKKSDAVDHKFEKFRSERKEGGIDQKCKAGLCSEQFGTKIGKISAAEPEREPQKNNLPC